MTNGGTEQTGRRQKRNGETVPASRFIQDKDFAGAKHGAGKTEQLHLSSGQLQNVDVGIQAAILVDEVHKLDTLKYLYDGLV